VRSARVRLIVALNGRRPLLPICALLLPVLGVYAYAPNDVGGSYAVTSLLGFALAAWRVAAVERELPEPAEAMLTVAAGGFAAAWRGRLVVVAVVALVVSATFLAYPLVLRAFHPGAKVGDVLVAGLLHVAATAAGGTLALALARPVRPATAFAVTVAALLATIALEGPLGPLAGPGGGAQAYADAPGDLDGPLLAALAVTALQAAAFAWLSRVAARARG
jgi:hypothetical protein